MEETDTMWPSFRASIGPRNARMVWNEETVKGVKKRGHTLMVPMTLTSKDRFISSFVKSMKNLKASTAALQTTMSTLPEVSRLPGTGQSLTVFLFDFSRHPSHFLVFADVTPP